MTIKDSERISTSQSGDSGVDLDLPYRCVVNIDHTLPLPGEGDARTRIDELVDSQLSLVRRLSFSRASDIARDDSLAVKTVQNRLYDVQSTLFGSVVDLPDWRKSITENRPNGQRNTRGVWLLYTLAAEDGMACIDNPVPPVHKGVQPSRSQILSLGAYGLGGDAKTIGRVLLGKNPKTIINHRANLSKKLGLIGVPGEPGLSWMLSQGILELTHGGLETPSYTFHDAEKDAEEEYWLAPLEEIRSEMLKRGMNLDPAIG